MENLERSDRVGQPSRRSQRSWLPLHNPDAPEEDRDGLEGERFGLKSPEALVGEDVSIDLGRAVSRLGQRSQQILKLYYAGHTDEEIGAMLGISHQAVNMTRRLAIARLRELMSG